MGQRWVTAPEHLATADFDAAWPLLGTYLFPPPDLVPLVRHRCHFSDPPGPVDEGYPRRVGGCGSTVVVWTDKATGMRAAITCRDCGAGQVCGIGSADHPATRLVRRGFRCEQHRRR